MFGSGAGAACMPDTSINNNTTSEKVNVRRSSFVFISIPIKCPGLDGQKFYLRRREI